jgi:hypothetical protein
MRLKRGTPFEQGVEALWDKVEDLEAMRFPVLGALEGNDLEIRKKELLYGFLHGNPDFEKVLTDHRAHNYTYNSKLTRWTTSVQHIYTYRHHKFSLAFDFIGRFCNPL